jgi:ATP-binding cassette subfamily B protein/ATP-binding cassette subfamily C protein LapB
MTAALGTLTKNSLLTAFEAMLAYHFGNVERSTIKRLSPKALEELDFNSIKVICREVGLKTSNKKVDIKKIKSYQFPVIVFREDTKEAYFVLKVEDNIAKIKRDKNSSIESIPLSELRRYERVFFIQKPHSKPKHLEIGDQKDKSWFYNPIKKMWKRYIEVGFLTLFINLFGLALPLFTMNVYNRVIPNFATETLAVLAFGVGLIMIFDIILKSARLSIMENVTNSLANHFEEELFKKSLSIHAQNDHYHIGTKTNLFRELAFVKDFFATKLVSVLDLPFFFIATLTIYIISPVMAIVPLVAGGLIFGINFVMQYPISNLHKKSFKEAQSKQAYLVEQLHGIEEIKLANALPKRFHKWSKIVDFYNHINGKMQFLTGATNFVSYTILQAVSLFSVVIGVFVIHEGDLSVGGLIAITILSARAMVPVMALSGSMIRYKQVKDALDSLNNYWHLPSESEKYIEMGIGKIRGEIEFEDVSFAYPNAKYPTLMNISFKIKEGEKVAIIGQTGSGKTTLQKLLTGILRPSSGKIYIDNHDIASLHPVEIRENIALMPQEPYIFSGTLKENLELSESISKAKMDEILSRSGLISLLKKAGSADDFEVGERGKNLSVGQRHLVALARALLSESPILILDEPTTGLDVGLEKSLVSELKSSVEDKTLILITHRFAALDLVDRVILLNDGKIIADGKKEKVLAMLKGSIS